MRFTTKLLGVAAAAGLAFGASAAWADVFVTADITKTKDLTVTEDIYIFKTIELYVFEDIFVDSVAEQDIIKNQRNEFQYVQAENDQSTNEILGSVTGANGIVLINQSAGFLNNQGNEVSVVYANTPFFEDGVFVHAQVDVEQINQVNELSNVFPAENLDVIDGSFGEGSGIVGVNQAAGHMNNQDNAIAIAMGDFAVYALGEADLGQLNTLNIVNVDSQIRRDSIVNGSFSGFNGVAMVSQSAGSMNNQANVVDIAVSLSGLPSL